MYTCEYDLIEQKENQNLTEISSCSGVLVVFELLGFELSLSPWIWKIWSGLETPALPSNTSHKYTSLPSLKPAP
jgi:hypothetical protein